MLIWLFFCQNHLRDPKFYDNINTFLGGLAQLARASALHAEGRGFESHSLHQEEYKKSL